MKTNLHDIVGNLQEYQYRNIWYLQRAMIRFIAIRDGKVVYRGAPRARWREYNFEFNAVIENLWDEAGCPRPNMSQVKWI